MVRVVMVGVSVHQEFQASQEALDPRDQQVLRDHPVIMDLKDPWAHGERKAMKETVEDRDHQAAKELKDLQAQAVTKVKQVPLALRDLEDPQVQLVPLETRVIQALVESKVLLAPRDPKGPQVQLVPLETRVIQALVESKVLLAPRDLRGPQVQLVPMETRVIQELVEVKVPQVPRVLQDRLVVIGNSAFLRRKMEGTLDWSR